MRTVPASITLLAALAAAGAVAVRDITPRVTTEPMAVDVDDPAIWVNPRDPGASLIIGTIKREAPLGGLAVYHLDGTVSETHLDLDRPNNVDILGDIAVATERLKRQLVIYRVSAEKPNLRRLGSVPVFAGESGEAAAPMGIALYQRPRDRALYAIVSRKTGPAAGYLAQYRLSITATGVTGSEVRRFGAFSGAAEIEAVAVDASAGLVYYSDEDCCVRVYRADPDAPNAGSPVRQIAKTGFRGNREGIAITGRYAIITDQLAGRSEYHLYRRDTGAEAGVVRGQSDTTDGIDALARALGPRFPRGIFIAMNSNARGFHFYDWRDFPR